MVKIVFFLFCFQIPLDNIINSFTVVLLINLLKYRNFIQEFSLRILLMLILFVSTYLLTKKIWKNPF